MANLLVIQLKVPVWGFAGQASGQREFADDQTEVQHVFLIGGASQVWLPKVEPSHVTQLAAIG
jgi:hypothetical protein